MSHTKKSKKQQQQQQKKQEHHVQFSEPLEQVKMIKDDTILTWSIVVKPHEPFSFDTVPDGSLLHVTSAILEVELKKQLGSTEQINANEAELDRILNEQKTTGIKAPMPKHIEQYLKARQSMELKYNSKLGDTKPHGCALQVCLFDPEEKKRRKFVVATLSTKASTELKLDHRFDTEQINNLTFEMKGRPELDSKFCKVHLIGSFLIPGTAPNEKLARKIALTNHHEEKVKNLLREKDPDHAPWKIQLMERNKQIREKDLEEEDKVKEDHTDPKQFIRKGVEIFNVLVGHGRRAQIGDRVGVAYKGRLNPDANKCFDKTNLKHPFTFRLGSKKVIKGINIGVEGMTLNGKRELVIPPNRAFGVQGIEEKVPPNSTVYYDVELVTLVPKKKAEQQRVKDQQEKQKEDNAKKRKSYAGINKLTKDFVTLADEKKNKKRKM